MLRRYLHSIYIVFTTAFCIYIEFTAIYVGMYTVISSIV